MSSAEKQLVAQEKYAPSCGTSLAISRYYAGQPLSRIEKLQKLQGIPLADATQWDIIKKLHDDCIAAVFSALEEKAAQADEHDFDDTSNTVLSLKAAQRNAHTTSVIARTGSQTIQLFYTGSAIAKHNISALIAKRTALTPLLTMCDASSQNVPDLSAQAVLFTWVFCLCLVHGRRKFYDILKHFTVECEFVLDLIGEVYQHERYCKNKNYDPEQRLRYHQAHSAPLMDALRLWCDAQIHHRFVESNSELGKAILYLLRHWEGLTRFLHVAGAPLDNSLCEQSMKIVIRHRRNSLFYKTEQGARVGDAMMSVIHTAALNRVNVFDYLNVLQEHRVGVRLTPHLFLPWNYQETVASSRSRAA